VAHTQAAYDEAGIEATVVPFIDDMPATLSRTALAVTRAGGTTLAELAAAGVPAILVPYPAASEDHQRHNARAFVDVGGGTIVDCADPGQLAAQLQQPLLELLPNPERRVAMRRRVLAISQPDAAQRVAALIPSLLLECGDVSPLCFSSRSHAPRGNAHTGRSAAPRASARGAGKGGVTTRSVGTSGER
jgi:UDP-N-acetylglucosamine--N-acetylmuramyl-(pentapeptide) pyrophosphoryl-undecaprenol N-acetylglucosamine transferase